MSEPVNRLRFLVQDTADAGHFLEDSEIEFVVGEEPNIYRAAATLCRTIAAKIAKDVGFDDDQIDYDPDAKSKTYIELAKSYDKKADRADGSLDTGSGDGLSLPSVSSAGPAFTRDLHFSN